MYAIYGLPFTINTPQMLAYIPYMDPMGNNMFYVCMCLIVFDCLSFPSLQQAHPADGAKTRRCEAGRPTTAGCMS